MSLVGTLGKVALGIVVARGVGKAMSGSSGGGLGGLLSGALGGGSGGGLGGLLGGAQGGQQTPAGQQPQDGQQSGGLGGLLGNALGGAGGGGLGGLLSGAGGAAGGLGGLLGGGAGAGASGGLGGLLESLGGAATAGGAAGGLGGLLNGALGGEQPAEQPNQQQEETAKILIQAMVNAAKSDGQIDEDEQQKIVANLGDEVSEEERQFVLGEMQSPLNIEAFINSVPRGAEQQVYLMSLLGIKLDSQAEAQYLDKLRQGFGMTEEASNAIHAQLGVPPLYG